MAQYPIKMLKDENGTPFVPLVAPEAVKDNQGTNWQALIDKKLEKTNIIAGDNITLSVSGNDITINSQDIPTKTSDLTNDSGFIDSSYHDNTKQDTLVSGTNIKTINNESILGEGNISISGGSSLNNVLDGNAIGSARTIGAKDSEGQSLGEYAWAEGSNTIARGWGSHAEGNNTIASGESSHAEGSYTTASGIQSHAEGYNTTASGQISHAEGRGTVAQGKNQHVQGIYNIEDTTSAHIVGNGGDNYSRSNAHTLDWQGNAWFAGDVYTGSTSGKNKDDGSKKLATEEYVDNSVNGIVESGSNANGNWIKYNDGTMICTKKHTGTANVNVALGSIFYNGYYAMAGDLPQNFIEAPYFSATNVESEWEIWGLQTKPVTTSKWTTRVDLMSATSQSDKPITITMIAIGKWK